MKSLSAKDSHWKARKKILFFLLGLTVLFFISCNSNSDSVAGGSSSTETGDPISLTGRVIDKGSSPVSGVIVVLTKAGIADTTDSQGKYHINRNAASSKSAKRSFQPDVDTLIFAQAGQEFAALGVTRLVDSLPDVKIVQRNISGSLLPSTVRIGKVEAILSGDGISSGKPFVVEFFYNSLAGNYSGFVYFPAPLSLQNFSVYINVYDSSGHLSGRSKTVPFNSLAGDITIPVFNPANAIPVANAGRDTALRANDLFALHGTAVDSFGAIVKWQWDIGGTGIFKTTHSGDTIIQMPAQSSARYLCVLRVIDNDGNISSNDTLVVTFSVGAPVVALNPPVLSTMDTLPNWIWNSGGGGIGTYRYKLDNADLSAGSTQTLIRSYTPASPLSYGNHTLYVQEQNSQGIWSPTGSASVMIPNPVKQKLTVMGDTGTILKSTDSGVTWGAQASPTQVNLNSGYYASAVIGWAVGNNGAIITTQAVNPLWFFQTSTATLSLNSVYFIDKNTGWAAGNAGIYATVNSGNTWTAQGNFKSDSLNAILFMNGNTGWTVGHHGTIRKTMDGGNTWPTQTSGTTANLMSIYFADANTGWVVGEGGRILKTVNGGATWTAQISNTASLLTSIYFASSNIGWVVGANGTILKTSNGGATWVVQASGTTNLLCSTYFSDVNAGWAVGAGGIILKTANGGATWMGQVSGTTKTLRSISAIP